MTPRAAMKMSVKLLLLLLISAVTIRPVYGQIPIGMSLSAQQTAAWSSTTSQNAQIAQTLAVTPTVLVGFNASGTISGGAITFEITNALDGNSNWQQVSCFRMGALPQVDQSYTLTGINQYWQCSSAGATVFRVRLSTVISGTGTANMSLQGSSGALPVSATVAEKALRTPTNSQPAVSTVASAVLSAGGAGVRHVADCISFSAMNTTAITATQVQVNLRDGASGAGTVLWSAQIFLPAGPGQAIAPFSQCGFALRGSPGTAMTLEFTAAPTNIFESVTLTTYDVQ